MLLVVVGTLVGALLIASFERYRVPLRDWLLADPGALPQRARAAFLLLAALALAPLLALAVYLWSFGAKVASAREFPPPGHRVVRDARVLTGEAAVARGRRFKGLAIGCGIAAVVLAALLWRVVSSIGPGWRMTT